MPARKDRTYRREGDPRPVQSVSHRVRYLATLGVIAAILAVRPAPVDPPAQAAAAPPPHAASLTGQFLVATEEMRDPRFARTVIYMVRHDATGAMGLVVNRPFREVSIAVLLERLGLDAKGVTGNIRLHYGGPVEPGRVFLLHTADYTAEDTRIVAGGIAVTGNPEILRALGAGKGPRRSLLALGYAGWAPGQLEAELQTGAWATVPADAALLFDDKHDTKWDRAIARRKIDL